VPGHYQKRVARAETERARFEADRSGYAKERLLAVVNDNPDGIEITPEEADEFLSDRERFIALTQDANPPLLERVLASEPQVEPKPLDPGEVAHLLPSLETCVSAPDEAIRSLAMESRDSLRKLLPPSRDSGI
jgi:hypothetical protein